ncbi:HET-domain-containing protein [Hypoxylon trugodes]|uniref:HET-domain-containing protein n=1 Tax=Hypoxylon trugodes TaxID=326681 RepID=UPI0021A244A7|nr:HET-domain-containing protein [Hypoxylon trugodes]KAI1388957.1 HET-domain-containing protein [Hypoxylon trugodes]
MIPETWCDVCCNFSLDIAREAELTPGFKNRYQNSGYYAGRFETGYQIDCQCQFIKESRSSGCEYCRFLSEVIDTFIPNQTIDGDSMLLCLREDSTFIHFLPTNPNTINGRINFQGVVYIYRPTDSISKQSGSAYAHIPVLPDIKPPSSEESFTYLKACLKTCIETHDSCQQDLLSPPKRLLQLGTRGNGSVRLYETPNDFREPYVALSYCWGKSSVLKTESSNIQSLMRGFDLKQLPAAVQDAAYVTQKLGLKYLWVDALCIIQDSKLDWEDQSAKMCSIYEKAHLTIIASSSDAANVSFLDHSARPETFHYHVPGKQDILLGARRECKSGHHFDSSMGIGNRVAPDPTIVRGWTLQEAILPTRAISYSTDELQWHCRSTRSCECQSRTNDQQVASFLIGRSQLETLEQWDKLVRIYTQRQLTYLEDKFPAISGISQLIHEQTGWQYLAGLWKEHFISQLLWTRHSFHPFFEDADTSMPPKFRAPSFSWASLECPIITFTTNPDVVEQAATLHEDAKLVDSNILLSGVDPFGRVELGSSITMEGRMMQDVELHGPMDDEYANYSVLLGGRDLTFEADIQLETFCFTAANGLPQRTARRSAKPANEGFIKLEGRTMVSVFLLAHSQDADGLGTQFFLFLSASPLNSNHNRYERLGVLMMGINSQEGYNLLDFSGLPVQRFTIF